MTAIDLLKLKYSPEWYEFGARILSSFSMRSTYCGSKHSILNLRFGIPSSINIGPPRKGWWRVVVQVRQEVGLAFLKE